MEGEKHGNLMLSRKVGETIRIGNDVTVTVLEIRRGETVLRINAPKSVRVLRSELEGSPPREKQ